jgi:hypothetical protein
VGELRFIVLAAALAACGPTTSSSVALSQPVKTAPAADGVITMARPMLGRATTEDRNGVVVHWELARGPLVNDEVVFHGIGKTLATLQVDVVGPDGKRTQLSAGAVVTEDKFRARAELRADASLALWLDREGAWVVRKDRQSVGVRWKSPPAADLFWRAGRYRITVAGTASMAGRPSIPFRTPEVAIDVAAPSAERVATARVIAAAVAAAALRPEGPFSDGSVQWARDHAIVVDQPDGIRRVMLVFSMEWDTHRYHVDVTPAGEVVGEMIYIYVPGCVAAGTPIATPSGPRSVETLRAGDLVLARDPATGRELAVPLLAVRSREAARVVEVDGLRLTANHPVWRDGAWTPAGALASATIDGPIEVYDLSVAWPHTFIAAGVLVHNKSIDPSSIKQPPPGHRDPWLQWWSPAARGAD